MAVKTIAQQNKEKIQISMSREIDNCINQITNQLVKRYNFIQDKKEIDKVSKRYISVRLMFSNPTAGMIVSFDFDRDHIRFNINCNENTYNKDKMKKVNLRDRSCSFVSDKVNIELLDVYNKKKSAFINTTKKGITKATALYKILKAS